MCMHMYVQNCVCVSMCTGIYVHVYAYMCMHMYIQNCVCTCIHGTRNISSILGGSAHTSTAEEGESETNRYTHVYMVYTECILVDIYIYVIYIYVIYIYVIYIYIYVIYEYVVIYIYVIYIYIYVIYIYVYQNILLTLCRYIYHVIHLGMGWLRWVVSFKL